MWVWGWGPRGGWGSWLLNKKELTRPNRLSGAGWGEWQMGEEKAEHPDWRVRASVIHSTINWHLPGTIPDTGTQRWTRPGLARGCLLSTGLSARGLIGGTETDWKARWGWDEYQTQPSLVVFIGTWCSLSNRMILEAPKRGSGTGQSVRWLWRTDSGSFAKMPKAAGDLRRKKRERGLSRRSKKQDKGKLFLNLSFCTSVRVWIGLLVYEPFFFSW